MGTYLKQLRIEKGMTQAQVADIIGISDRQYQRIENLEGYPSYKVILKLQSYFNKPVDQLLSTKIL